MLKILLIMRPMIMNCLEEFIILWGFLHYIKVLN